MGCLVGGWARPTSLACVGSIEPIPSSAGPIRRAGSPRPARPRTRRRTRPGSARMLLRMRPLKSHATRAGRRIRGSTHHRSDRPSAPSRADRVGVHAGLDVQSRVSKRLVGAFSGPHTSRSPIRIGTGPNRIHIRELCPFGATFGEPAGARSLFPLKPVRMVPIAVVLGLQRVEILVGERTDIDCVVSIARYDQSQFVRVASPQ